MLLGGVPRDPAEAVPSVSNPTHITGLIVHGRGRVPQSHARNVKLRAVRLRQGSSDARSVVATEAASGGSLASSAAGGATSASAAGLTGSP